MLSFPPMNYFPFGSVKFHSRTLSHFFLQTNSPACSAQNCSGLSTLFLYSARYCSKEVIRLIERNYESNLKLFSEEKTVKFHSGSTSCFVQDPILSGGGSE